MVEQFGTFGLELFFFHCAADRGAEDTVTSNQNVRIAKGSGSVEPADGTSSSRFIGQQ